MKLKTTIIVADEDWNAFNLKVFKTKGNRQLNAVMNKLIKGYNEGKFAV